MRPVTLPSTVIGPFGNGASVRNGPRRSVRGHGASHRACSRVTAAGGENVEVQVCTNTSCRKLGSKQVVRYFEELVDSSQVTVKETGCLGQ
eukprot:3836788-Pyramimonas_sp.AAC.1